MSQQLDFKEMAEPSDNENLDENSDIDPGEFMDEAFADNDGEACEDIMTEGVAKEIAAKKLVPVSQPSGTDDVEHALVAETLKSEVDAVAMALDTMRAVQAAGASVKEQVDIAAQAAATKGMSKAKLFTMGLLMCDICLTQPAILCRHPFCREHKSKV